MKRINAERTLAVDATVENLGRRQRYPSVAAARRVQVPPPTWEDIDTVAKLMGKNGKKYATVANKALGIA